jgi:hypothetical protein
MKKCILIVGILIVVGGVYIIRDKISVAQTGMPVKIGYDKKDSL